MDFEPISDQRCDGCPQRAIARLDLDSGGRLYFCGHHARALAIDPDVEFLITYATVEVP
jgi:hypothetical protein